MDGNEQKNTESSGFYVEKYTTDHVMRAQGAGIPVYEKYKGKEAVGSKEWKTTKGESIALYIFIGVALVVAIGAAVAYFLPIALGLKILLIVIAGLVILLGSGGLVLVIALRHNKKDPMEMHYYDVDVEHNFITKEGHENIKEISREEFYSGKKE